MIKKTIFIYIALLLTVQVFSQRTDKQSIPKPSLIVGIIVEQMRYDYIMRFWDRFGEGGFKKLVTGGTNCRQASIDYLYPYVSSSQATIVCGANPRSHGIIADEWFDRIRSKTVTATGDEAYPIASGSDKDMMHAPTKLAVSTIGDELKLANKQSKIISISCRPMSAILLAGHAADAAYWLDEGTGEWTTSTYYKTSLPQWTNDFNTKKYADIYMAKTWTPMLPFEKYNDCLPDKNDYEFGINSQISFPYQLSSLADSYKKYKLLKTTPFGNSFTKDFAIQTIVGESLGKDPNTDMLFVSFSSTETIGNRFGPRSIELADTYIRLDKEIEFLLQFIEKEIGKFNTLVFLTTTSGVSDIPKHMSDQRILSGQFKQAKAEQLLKSYLNALYGQNEWVSYYGKQHFYLNQTLIEDKKLNINEIQEKSASFLVKLTGVSQVFTQSQILNNNFTEGTWQKAYNIFNQKRSGDILINLEPGWMEQSSTEVTSHISPYNYDTHIPLVWYGWKVERLSLSKPVSLTDIAPTLAAVLKIAEPNACSGKPISEILIND